MNENGEFDFKSFKKACEMVDPQTTLFLFDMSTGNNFIGTRRTKEDNENIAQVLIDKRFYSEHDIAYPNFDPDFDSEWEVYRILQKAGAPHGVQSSRGKKDKYASRLAFHHLYLGSGEQRAEIFTHLVTENRNTFLAMPDTWMHLTEIARDPSLQDAHKRDNQIFVEIVNNSRKKLSEALSWNWMKKRSGMFDMVNITHEGGDKLGEEYGIYVVPARNQNLIGKDTQPVEVIRIKHGLSDAKIQKVAVALQEVIKKYPSEPGRKNPGVIIAD
jgi:aspartate/tyrosine/aromatic aminotransferase